MCKLAVMSFHIPTPGEVLGFAKSTASWAVDSATVLATAPSRVSQLLDGADALLVRAHAIADGADELIKHATSTADEARDLILEAGKVAEAAADTVARAGQISHSAEAVIQRAEEVSDRASTTVTDAAQIASKTDELLSVYVPMAKRAAPLAERFVNELSEAEVDAAIRLVDELPVLTEHILTDILPILRTLDRVGPEIHELLEVTHDVRRAIVGIPGFQFFRRRGQDRVNVEETTQGNNNHYPLDNHSH